MNIFATTKRRAMSLRRTQRGVAMVEYTIVALFIVIVLIATDGPDGNVIKKLADAIRNAYASFVYALSVSWF